MRKGDDRRQSILETAERLFYARGYEGTSVQDIIDALNFSKGGFYHHFESKLALLEAICEERAQLCLEQAEAAVAACRGDAVAMLNALFETSTILRSEGANFLSLLIRVAYREDGALMREKLKQRQLELTLPLMRQIVDLGVESQVFFTPFPIQMPELVLRLVAQLTDEIAFLLATRSHDPEVVVAILEKLELYRHAVERLLDAPFGSIIIFRIGNMAELCKRVLEQQAVGS